PTKVPRSLVPRFAHSTACVFSLAVTTVPAIWPASLIARASAPRAPVRKPRRVMVPLSHTTACGRLDPLPQDVPTICPCSLMPKEKPTICPRLLIAKASPSPLPESVLSSMMESVAHNTGCSTTPRGSQQLQDLPTIWLRSLIAKAWLPLAPGSAPRLMMERDV